MTANAVADLLHGRCTGPSRGQAKYPAHRIPLSSICEEGSGRVLTGQPEYADDTLTLKFTEHYGDDLRYTAAWGQWSKWNGRAWKPDTTLHIFNLAREICRKESATCEDERLAHRIASAQTITAVERLARADRRHAATVEQWDSNPWVLNTPGGIVDLPTGKLRDAMREDYCSKMTAVAPGGECPRWLAFLARITGGNQELQSFMQRMAGYALTGETREHALFFLYGTGANGKSVFLNTISGLMADYATTASTETFIDSKNQNHPTDLAALRGARLVTAIETEEGRRWSESRLKALTGGDRIAARYMRQDFFQFVPQFKLLVAGNHKPGLRSVDEAIRRRFNLIPFNVTIPPDERDLELVDKLEAEWGGILQWAIDGCLQWLKDGLSAPETVTAATGAYLAEEDTVSRWIEDCCEVKKTLWTPATELFNSWRRWADSNQEPAGKQKEFSLALESRGYVSKRQRVEAGKNPLRGFAGIGIVPDVPGQSVSPITRARERTKQYDAAQAAQEPNDGVLVV